VPDESREHVDVRDALKKNGLKRKHTFSGKKNMELPLTHRYLPKTFDDLPKETTDVLKCFLKADAFHVLITGSTNTGKTATCTVLLREYYGDDVSKIMTLGGLKEQGMTFFRTDVKCFCQTTVHGKKKTLVVNDVDEFPEPAQQVLLNYIDNYRDRVNFVMTARYEVAVIQAMHSRLVRLHLHPLSDDFIERIVRKTNDALSDEVVALISKRAAHSAAAAINCVEKLTLLDSYTTDEVERVFGMIHPEKLDIFTEFVEAGKQKEATLYLCSFLENGFSVIDVLDSIAFYVKGSPLRESRKYRYVKVICKYTAVFNLVHEHPLELAFFVNDLCCSERT
jgi:DNA polymerase III delta prime subunit